MAETTFDAAAVYSDANIRKGLKGALFWAPMSQAVPASITADSSTTPGTPALQALTGFSPLGRLDASGAVSSSDESDSTVTPWGSLAPARRDITGDVTTLKVSALETNKQSLALYHGVDPSAIVPDATTGELHIRKALSPVALYRRLILLTEDGAPGEEYWQGLIMPRASLTTRGDRTWMSGDTVILYDMTFTAFVDPDEGYDVDNFYAGPAWKSGLTGAGFGA